MLKETKKLKKKLVSPLFAVTSLLVLTVSEVSQVIPSKRHTEGCSYLGNLGFPEKPHTPVLSPDGRQVAFLRNDSVWIAHSHDTSVPARRISIGISSEDNLASIIWSSDGNSILLSGYFGKDHAWESKIISVRKNIISPFPFPADLQVFMPLAWSPVDSRIAFIAKVKQHRPGSSSQIYVYNAADHSVQQLTDDNTVKTALAWSPDGRSIAYATMTPGLGPALSTISLASVSAQKSATPRVVWRETENATRNVVVKLIWAPDGKSLLVQQELPGLSSYDTGTEKLLARIVSSDGMRNTVLPGIRFVGWTADSQALIGSMIMGMARHIVMVGSLTGSISQLTAGDSNVSIPFGTRPRMSNRKLLTELVFTSEAGSVPRDVWTARLGPDGRLRDRLNVSRSNTCFSTASAPSSNIYRWFSAEGDTLEAQLFVPEHPRGRIPLIVVPYGGFRNAFPDVHDFMERAAMQLVQDGFAVAYPNARGRTTDRSDTARYGEPQLQDTLRLVDALGRDAIIDPIRVGVLGHSNGASLAYYYLTHSNRFCGVIAVNGRADWIAQAKNDGFLIKAMGGTPEHRPELYRLFSPLLNVDSVTSPLLAVVGELDTQVLPMNGHRIVDALRAMGKDATLLSFQNEGHVITQPENFQKFMEATRVHLRRACSANNRVE